MLDHKDRNRENNSINNLRICTKSQNAWNCEKKKSKHLKGVKKSGNKFTAQIGYKMNRIHLGSYQTEIEAHAAYCDAAKKYHGEFANIESQK